MTIDTSREAVELRLTRLRAAYEEFRAPYGHIAALITQAKLTETMIDALLAERDAALAEVARLTTPPDDAEVAELVERARNWWWSSDPTGAVPLLNATADALTRLSHALAAETAKREAMEGALREALAGLVAATSLLSRGSKKAAPSDKMFDQMIADYQASAKRARATLAQHGKVK